MKIGKATVNVRLPNAQGVKVTTPVGEAQFKIYETVDEAVDDLGSERLLEILNIQIKTLAMNELRDLHRPGEPSKTALRNEAQSRITTEQIQTAMQEAIAAGRPPLEAVEDLIKATVDLIKAERANKVAAMAAAAGDDEDEDD